MSTKKVSKRDKKKIHIRKKITGTTEKPRLAVFRSNLSIYAQLIDDSKNTTIAAVSTKSKDLADVIKDAKGKIAQSALVGEAIAKKAVELGINEVVFDRGGYIYHGRVKAVADGARKGGLKF